jgi:Gas vesicle synthesis protein GvpL/GvpF
VSLLYLYAVIDEEPSSLEEPLRLVRCGELLIVTGGEAPPLIPENLAAQDAVVRRLNAPAVLPIRFGETVRDEDELCKLLKPRTPDLLAALDRVRGCEQMTLRVFGEPVPLPEPPEQGGPGTRYLEARRREAERSRSLPEIEPLLDRLRPLVKAERIERKEQGKLLGTVYHLVRKEDLQTYKERAREDGVAVSGPWPPYAFAPGLGDPV